MKCRNFVLLFLMFLSLNFSLYAQEDYQIEVEVISFEELMKMAVTTASKKAESINDAPGILSVYSKKEIEGFAANNLGEILNRLAGTIFLSANVFTDNVISMRGQTTTPYNNHILILLNGRPVRDPITGGLNNAMFTSFPVNIIDHIEVIRGPGSVLYGSCAYSGVINVVTMKAEKDKSSYVLQADFGSYKAFGQQFSGTISKNDINFTFGLNHFKDDGPEFAFTDYLGVYNKANFEKEILSGFANFNYKNLNINTLLLDYKPYALAGADNNWDLDDPMDNNLHTHFFLDAGYSLVLGDGLGLDMNLTYNRREWNTNNGQEQLGYSIMPELLFKYSIGEKGNLLVGGSYSVDDYSGDLLIDGDIWAASIYAQFDYNVSEKVKLIAGFQFNKLEGIDGNLSPRIGMVAHLNDKLGFKALYSQAFRKGYPLETSFDVIVFKGNLELKPELIDTYEGQFFYQDDRIQSSATFFFSRMSDMIIRQLFVDPSVPPLGWYLQYINKGEHDFYGFEWEGKFSLSENVMLTGSYVYQTNERDDGVEDATLHPNSYLKLGLLYQDNIYSLGIFSSYFGEPTQVSVLNKDVNNINPMPESFNLVSVKASIELLQALKVRSDYRLYLFVEGENLLDKDIRYPEYTTRGVNSLIPLREGMTLKGGLKLKF